MSNEETKVWVLTSEINEYDQAGEYFEAVFINKPTAEQIQIHCEFLESSMEKDQLVSHILAGGGRVGDEYCWYHLRQEDAITQPKREWVGLTDGEIEYLFEKFDFDGRAYFRALVKDVEEKLKEKNT